MEFACCHLAIFAIIVVLVAIRKVYAICSTVRLQFALGLHFLLSLSIITQTG